jgi:uncharacterized sulfatase
MYEDMVRIPLIVRPPGGLGVLHNCNHLISQVDLTPTIIRLCGGEPPEHLQGLDATRLMLGEDEPIRDFVAAEYHSATWTNPLIPLRMWRTDKWKYVETLQDDHELYDLERDPDELHNLASDPTYVNQLQAMRAALHDWLKETGDAWPEVPQPPGPLKDDDLGYLYLDLINWKG